MNVGQKRPNYTRIVIVLELLADILYINNSTLEQKRPNNTDLSYTNHCSSTSKLKFNFLNSYE